jgi:hypothetical protein
MPALVAGIDVFGGTNSEKTVMAGTFGVQHECP